MGRSTPSFAHEECAYAGVNGAGVNAPFEMDPANATSIRLSLDKTKDRVFSCWTCDKCGFNLNATQKDGTVKQFHFLQYSGTHQLAQDIERFRIAINVPKLSVYGISYGTTVMGTYATMFGDKVDKLILDANVDPTSDLMEFSKAVGIGQETRIDYLIYSCEVRNWPNTVGSCPVNDMRGCVNDLNDVISIYPFATAQRTFILQLFLEALYTDDKMASEICNAAAAVDVGKLTEVFGALIDTRDYLQSTNAKSASANSTMQLNECGSQPTSANNVCGIPDYRFLMEKATIPQAMVFGQDYTGGSYNADFFIREVLDFNAKYTGVSARLYS
jgi:pimeloyl-ACP methyl ester carboxylesterase